MLVQALKAQLEQAQADLAAVSAQKDKVRSLFRSARARTVLALVAIASGVCCWARVDGLHGCGVADWAW